MARRAPSTAGSVGSAGSAASAESSPDEPLEPPKRALYLRFPSRLEIRYSAATPERGDVVTANGSDWVVRSVETTPSYVSCVLEVVAEPADPT